MTDETETDGTDTDVLPGEEDERRPGGKPAEPPPYDPLRRYDPQLEFSFIERDRAVIDERLLGITGPFARMVILLVRVSAYSVLWAALAVPMMEAVRYFGWTPPGWLHYAVILTIPAAVLIYTVLQVFVLMRFQFKWAAVFIEMYLDDEVSNKLIQDNKGYSGELKGLHAGSNTALLELLRLRMKAFHFWHRISIHAFILNGAFFRGALETPFVSPRLYANGAPVLALVVFLSVQFGMFLGKGSAEPPLVATTAFLAQLRDALLIPRMGHDGAGWPVIAVMAIGFAMAFLSYRLARDTRGKVIARLEVFLNTEHFLTPSTHDCSRAILAKHARLLRVLAKLCARRNGYGGAGEALSSLLLEDDADTEDGRSPA